LLADIKAVSSAIGLDNLVEKLIQGTDLPTKTLTLQEKKHNLKKSIAGPVDEQREELKRSLETISNILKIGQEDNGEVALPIIAKELYKLVVEPAYLLNIAKQKGYLLTVFANPMYIKKVLDMQPVLFSALMPFDLEKGGPFSQEITLDDALKIPYIVRGNEQIDFEEFLSVMTDPNEYHITSSGRELELGGLPSEYRSLFEAGRLFLKLGEGVVNATN
jgi:hypothetical protein